MRIVVDLDYTLVDQPQHWNNWQWWHDDLWDYARLEPLPDAVTVLQNLKAQGHSLRIVTARPSHPVNAQWVRENLPFYVPLTEGTPDKWNVQADIYLDDSPTVLQGLWERGLCAVKFAAAHNADAPCSYEVHGWMEFLNLMERRPDVKVQKRKRTDPYKRKRAVDGDRA